jgi:glycine cleavage system aminomethyltransferase T
MIRRACGCGNDPMKRSALHSEHSSAGATFGEYSGWELPAYFVDPDQEAAQICKSVGVADISYLSKFDLRNKPEQQSWCLSATHYLILSETSSAVPAEAIDVSSVYAVLRLAGPNSREVLRKLSSLNVSDTVLPNFGCAQASLAHIPGIFLREDIGTIPAFHLLITRDYAESAWKAILHAGHEFRLCPSGVEALHSLSN